VPADKGSAEGEEAPPMPTADPRREDCVGAAAGARTVELSEYRRSGPDAFHCITDPRRWWVPATRSMGHVEQHGRSER